MKKIIDLSMNINEKMHTYNVHWHPKVKIKKLGSFKKVNRETRQITIGTHTGTHVDAPRHFIKKGKTIEHIPLSTLCGEAIILDFSKFPLKKEIQVEDLKKKLGKKKIKPRVVIRYDWELRSNKKNYFTDHPFLSKKACEWLVKKKIKLIALDCPQPDNPLNSKGSPCDAENHKVLLGKNIIIAEYLINLKKIKKKYFDLYICPLKIDQGDGSPARCFAVV